MSCAVVLWSWGGESECTDGTTEVTPGCVRKDGFHISDPGGNVAKLPVGQEKIRKIWWLHFAFEILYDTGIVLSRPSLPPCHLSNNAGMMEAFPEAQVLLSPFPCSAMSKAQFGTSMCKMLINALLLITGLTNPL